MFSLVVYLRYICFCKVDTLTVLQVNRQMYDSHRKWKHPPNCLVTTHVTSKLKFHHLVVCIQSGNAKHHHAAPIVHIFANVFDGFDGVAVLNIAAA